jgi:outer membrane lipoprotein-sorting protein
MRNILLILFIIFVTSNSYASNKENIVENLKSIKNFTFIFEQNINGKIQNGECTIQFPKRIFCIYNTKNKKILVSNGKSLVIKTKSSYYIYPLKKTPLNLILDKNYLIKKLKSLDERIINEKFINYVFSDNGNEISLFFDKKTFILNGWQTFDLYQNLSITYISPTNINNNLEKNLFKLPKRD